ncbi:DUF302 domain-containing protein [Halochromatium sp.]
MIEPLRATPFLLFVALLLSGVLPTALAESGVAKIPFVIETPSPYGTVEETVAVIKQNIESEPNWVVNGVKPMDKKIKELSGIEIPPVTLIDACNPYHAGEILKSDEDRYASVMMPCTIAVYEKTDGTVYVGTMNARLIGEMFGGAVAKIMGGTVAEDQERFLQLN